MTRKFFNLQFAALWSAFSSAQKLPPEKQDLYWSRLQKIPEDKFYASVCLSLDSCRFFPTINELGDAALPPKIVTVRGRTRFISATIPWYDQIDEPEVWKNKILLLEGPDGSGGEYERGRNQTREPQKINDSLPITLRKLTRN